ncbi:MAG: hypothetical protein OEQ13_03020 [Acidobacteriota bacterium]|nr:hypothetical protein [Acidobacteriota bacterium]
MRYAVLLILLTGLISCDPAPPAQAVTTQNGHAPASNGAWSFDAPLADIPHDELRGSLLGNEFRLEEATINGHAITLRGAFEADRFSAPDITIFVGTDDLARELVVTPTDDGMVPHIHTRFPVPGKQGPGMLMYTELYSMHLIVDEVNEDNVVARVHLSLPDYKKSHVVGRFVATVK